MMLTLLVWLQGHTPSSIAFTGDEIRTALLTVIIAVGGFIATRATQVLKVLRELQIDIHDLKRDIHGDDGKNGIKGDVRLLVRRVDAIEDRNIAIDAVVEAEREQWPYPDRRHGQRRLHDVIREAQEERSRRLADDQPLEDDR
jgi:hypothetical protein